MRRNGNVEIQKRTRKRTQWETTAQTTNTNKKANWKMVWRVSDRERRRKTNWVNACKQRAYRYKIRIRVFLSVARTRCVLTGDMRNVECVLVASMWNEDGEFSFIYGLCWRRSDRMNMIYSAEHRHAYTHTILYMGMGFHYTLHSSSSSFFLFIIV